MADKTSEKDAKQEKADRLSQALRDNLLKRKAQKRQRARTQQAVDSAPQNDQSMTKKASEYRKPLRLWSFMVTQWH